MVGSLAIFRIPLSFSGDFNSAKVLVVIVIGDIAVEQITIEEVTLLADMVR